MLSRLNSRLCIYSLLKQTTKHGQKQTNLLARCLSDGISDFPEEDLFDDEPDVFKFKTKKNRHQGQRNDFGSGFSQDEGKKYLRDFSRGGGDFSRGGEDFSRGGGNKYLGDFSRGGGNEFNRGSRGGNDYVGNNEHGGRSGSLSDDKSWLFQQESVNATGTIKKNNYQEHPEVQKATWDGLKKFCAKHEITFSKGDNIPKPVLKFEYANLQAQCMNIIKSEGWEEPTAIQSVSWPVVLSGKDLIGIAQTGSGKTLGFVHPAIIHCQNRGRVDTKEGPIGIVLVPTRELAQQVCQVANQFMNPCGMTSTAVFGGASKMRQMQELAQGTNLLIATPGRLNDFLSMGVISLRNCSYLVLDEADRMLDMGFEIQIRNIILSIRNDRQTLMWSATWPKEVQNLARDFLSNPVQINVGSTELKANDNITQTFKIINISEKPQMILTDISEVLNKGGKVLVFANSKAQADFITLKCRQKRIPSASIHGDKSQSERERMLYDFKSGIFNCLIATDVAARGLDITDITVVINYDCPGDVESYIHRIGRTGRAGKNGTSLTYLSYRVPQDEGAANKILEVLQRNGKTDPQLVEFAMRVGGIGGGRGNRGAFGAGRGYRGQGFGGGQGYGGGRGFGGGQGYGGGQGNRGGQGDEGGQGMERGRTVSVAKDRFKFSM